MIGATRLSKKQFYIAGGLANPRHFRRMRGHAWTYWSLK